MLGNWGISEKASDKEKIKSEMGDYLNGLNSTCVIDYNVYSEMFDFTYELLDRMYELGARSLDE